MKEKADKAPDQQDSRFKFRHGVYALLMLMLLLSIFSHKASDYDVMQGGIDGDFQNWIGTCGAYVSCFCFYLIGLAAYPAALLLALCAFRKFLPQSTRRKYYSVSLFAVIFGTTILFALSPQSFSQQVEYLGIGRQGAELSSLSGGLIGQFLAAPADGELKPGILRYFVGVVGCSLIASFFIFCGLFNLWLRDWHELMLGARERIKKVSDNGKKSVDKVPVPAAGKKESKITGFIDKAAGIKDSIVSGLSRKEEAAGENKNTAGIFYTPSKNNNSPLADNPPVAEVKTPRTAALDNLPATGSKVETAQKTSRSEPPRSTVREAHEYVLPPITMLSSGNAGGGESQEAIDSSCQILQHTLESFNVDGRVTGIVSGPRVTRYEISLAPGVKVEKVANIANNIAMELEAESIRILTPIPGKNAVGVEAPNTKAEAVFLRSMMEAKSWRDSSGQIPVILGKDVGGKLIILDLAKAPHLLIAGATGSGKSVCMNTLIMSLLFRFAPDELRLIMVDPKVVELECYSPLPHLITPVVNDPQKVPLALRWTVNEMEKRYRILAKAKVRNLAGYNARPVSKEVVLDHNGDPLPDKMPMLVIIVDELADVMMTDAKSEVETSIARIAQKGRAAGIHIVIATQRPSTNIITGVIKANLPTRIAFRVGSIVDSRVILDQKGAESLLGRGDMLYMPPGSANLERIQGAMVDDADINKVVEFVSAQAEQDFDSKVTADESEVEDDAPQSDQSPSIADAPDIAPVVQKYLDAGDSDLMRQALEIVLLERKASTSYLQRRLKIGYNKAAEMIDIFEERGIVSPPMPGGSKREIMVFDEIDGV